MSVAPFDGVRTDRLAFTSSAGGGFVGTLTPTVPMEGILRVYLFRPSTGDITELNILTPIVAPADFREGSMTVNGGVLFINIPDGNIANSVNYQIVVTYIY